MTVQEDDRLEGLNVPHSCGGIPPGGDEALAIGVPHEGGDAIRVADETTEQPAARDVPKPNHAILTGGSQSLAIRAKGQCAYGHVVPAKFEKTFLVIAFPQAHRMVVMAGRQHYALGGKSDRRNP